MALFILLSFCLIPEAHPQSQTTCGVQQFHCKCTGRCISIRWNCDGDNDCGDLSNEEECGSSTLFITTSESTNDIPPPQLVVSSTERGSVQLDCQTPSAGGSQCYFYPEGDDKNLKLSPSCQLSLTGSDLTRWTGHSYRSPEPVRVICYYAVSESGVNKTSPHSLPATVTVLDQKPVIQVSYHSQHDVFTALCEIPLSGSVRADFRCSLYTGRLLFLKGESRKGNFGMLSCVLTASKTDLLNRLRSVKSREVSCDYSLISDPSVRSPMSHTYDILNLLPTPAQPSVTVEKSTAASLASSARLITTKDPETAGSAHVTHQHQNLTDLVKTSSALHTIHTEAVTASSTAAKAEGRRPKSSLLIIILSVTGTSVLLAGVMTIIFVCRFIKNQRTDRLEVDSARGDQGDAMAMPSVEEFSPGAAGTYSMFTSETTSFHQSGPSKKGKETSEESESDVYHTYCTIPDIPVASRQNDSFYSLIQKE
ncbi:hypothetical protein SRHO_G00268040 [Serrasalmus rhombeus]